MKIVLGIIMNRYSTNITLHFSTFERLTRTKTLCFPDVAVPQSLCDTCPAIQTPPDFCSMKRKWKLLIISSTTPIRASTHVVCLELQGWTMDSGTPCILSACTLLTVHLTSATDRQRPWFGSTLAFRSLLYFCTELG